MERVAAGVDAEAESWTFVLSCPGCQALVEVEDGFGGGTGASTLAEGKHADRLLRRIEAARVAGTLAAEVRAALADRTGAILLGAPEFEAVVASLGPLRLKRDCAVEEGTGPGSPYPDPPRRLEPSAGVEAVLPAGTELAPVGTYRGILVCLAEGERVMVSLALVEPGA